MKGYKMSGGAVPSDGAGDQCSWMIILWISHWLAE